MLAPQPLNGRRPPTLVSVGGVVRSADPDTVYSTLLGSCIAVCFHDPEARCGGLNHFLLAQAPDHAKDDMRYGEVALATLLSQIERLGGQKQRISAVVAGGADILPNMHRIGTENTDFAVQWLRSQGIQIVKKDVGGTNARRVRFAPATGEIEVFTVDTPPIHPGLSFAVNRPATGLG